MKVQKTTLVCKQAGSNAAIRRGTRGERHELVKDGQDSSEKNVRKAFLTEETVK